MNKRTITMFRGKMWQEIFGKNFEDFDNITKTFCMLCHQNRGNANFKRTIGPKVLHDLQNRMLDHWLRSY